eukprot:SAG11_NODE_389_length_9870_cov_7.646812_1_plen_184_part_10
MFGLNKFERGERECHRRHLCAQGTHTHKQKKWLNKIIGGLPKFSHNKSLRPNELDVFEWVSLAHRKFTTSIAPELRHDFLIDAFEPKEAAVLEGFEQQHMDATGNALTYEELAAQACYSFRNPDSVEKLHRRIAARKQRDDETIESLLVDMDAMRSQLTRLGESISNTQFRIYIKNAVRPDIIT